MTALGQGTTRGLLEDAAVIIQVARQAVCGDWFGVFTLPASRGERETYTLALGMGPVVAKTAFQVRVLSYQRELSGVVIEPALEACAVQ